MPRVRQASSLPISRDKILCVCGTIVHYFPNHPARPSKGRSNLLGLTSKEIFNADSPWTCAHLLPSISSGIWTSIKVLSMVIEACSISNTLSWTSPSWRITDNKVSDWLWLSTIYLRSRIFGGGFCFLLAFACSWFDSFVCDDSRLPIFWLTLLVRTMWLVIQSLNSQMGI